MVAVGYVIVAIYEALKYKETTVCDQATSNFRIVHEPFHVLIKIKMEASGYPVGCTTSQGKKLISKAYVHMREYI